MEGWEGEAVLGGSSLACGSGSGMWQQENLNIGLDIVLFKTHLARARHKRQKVEETPISEGDDSQLHWLP